MNNGGIGSIKITKSKILIVEGQDEERLFNKYLESLAISDIQVLPIGGKTKLQANLKALSIDPNFMSKVKKLLIMRDADLNAKSAFLSVCSALFGAKLPIPARVLEPAGDDLVVNVMIIPDSSSSGMLEDLCLQAVSSDPAVSCIDSYIECLQALANFNMPNNLSKARVQAFLSSRIEPGKRLGEAAEAGYWPFHNPVFNPIKAFLSSI